MPTMPDPITLTNEQLEKLRAKGLPLTFDVGGQEVVIQDAEAYKRMLRVLNELEDAETARICMERLAKMESGEDPGIPARESIDELRKRFNLPREDAARANDT